MVLDTITVKSDEEMEDEANAFAGAFLFQLTKFAPSFDVSI